MSSVRIGNCSGYYGDRLSAMREMLEGGELDYLTGDYLAELTMLILGRDRMKDPSLRVREVVRQADDRLPRPRPGEGREDRRELRRPEPRRARGEDPRDRGRAGRRHRGRPRRGRRPGRTGRRARVRRRHDRERLPRRVRHRGGADRGADIVVTGRVTDASVVVGPAIAHHGWGRDDLDALAGAVVAGHVIECGTQATGGNFSGFTSIDYSRPLGFPIAEVARRRVLRDHQARRHRRRRHGRHRHGPADVRGRRSRLPRP